MGKLVSGLMMMVMFFVLGFSSVYAAPKPDARFVPNQAQLRDLLKIKYSLHTVADLEKRGVLTKEVADQQRQYYVTSAQATIGIPASGQSVASVLDKIEIPTGKSKPGYWDKLMGVMRSLSVMQFIGTCFVILALSMLFVKYVLPTLAILLYNIPAWFYEIMIYFACAGCIAAGTQFTPSVAPFIALIGCLGMIGGVSFSHFLHKDAIRAFYRNHGMREMCIWSLLLFVVWTGVAIAYDSQMIAFMAVMALESFLGFSAAISPLCYCIGFRSENALCRATSASFVVLVAGIAYRISGAAIPVADIFSTGMVFMGAFVYFIGLTILASDYYSSRHAFTYAQVQIIMIISGIAALYFGNVYDIYSLKEIGFGFFGLYLCEKYVLMTNFTKNIAWSTLGFGVIIVGVCMFMKQHPQYVSLFI